MLKTFHRLFVDLQHDESGTVVIEYAMVVSLIAMAIVTALNLTSAGIDTMFITLANKF